MLWFNSVVSSLFSNFQQENKEMYFWKCQSINTLIQNHRAGILKVVPDVFIGVVLMEIAEAHRKVHHELEENVSSFTLLPINY